MPGLGWSHRTFEARQDWHARRLLLLGRKRRLVISKYIPLEVGGLIGCDTFYSQFLAPLVGLLLLFPHAHIPRFRAFIVGMRKR